MQLKNLLPMTLAAVASAQSLTDALGANNATLSTLIGLLGTQPAIVSALGSAKNITILAPNNDALGKLLNSSAGMALASMPDVITAVLQYHVLNGTFPASSFSATPAFAPTLLTNASYTNVTGGQRVEAYANGSSVYIVSGNLAKSMVTKADIKFDGGVIHIIDSVLTLPTSVSSTATADNFTTLVGALKSANLVSTVDGLSDVTIFAPTDAAFGAISSALGNLSTSQLSSILTYHVVQGTVGYSTLLSNTTLKTVNGGNVTITVEGDNIFVNSARVVVPNVLVAGGVIHAIDNVLNPNNAAVSVVPTATSPASVAFSGASSVAASTVTGSARGTSTPAIVSTAGAAQALQTGAIGVGALLGGAAVLLNM